MRCHTATNAWLAGASGLKAVTGSPCTIASVTVASKGMRPDDLDVAFAAIRLDLGRACRIDVGLVDANQRRHAEVRGGRQHPFHVVDAGRGRLGHDQRQVGARCGRDDRAADARRPVHDHRVVAFVQRQQPRLLLDQRHQLAGVLLRRPQRGVEQRPVAAVRPEPVAGQLRHHVDGLLRALVDARRAAFAGDGIDGIGLTVRPSAVTRHRTGRRRSRCRTPGTAPDQSRPPSRR